jgi:hypothetical protein
MAKPETGKINLDSEFILSPPGPAEPSDTPPRARKILTAGGRPEPALQVSRAYSRRSAGQQNASARGVTDRRVGCGDRVTAPTSEKIHSA